MVQDLSKGVQLSTKCDSLYVIRHGKTKWNAEGKLQGRLNSLLLPESRKFLGDIGSYFFDHGIEAVYSSPLQRCRDSAEIICDIVGVPAIYIGELTECDHGECEGLTLDKSKDRFPDFFAERESADKWFVRWPGGESYADVACRIEGAVKKIDLNKRCLIIAHETANKILVGQLVGWSRIEIMERKQKNNDIFLVDPANRNFSVITL